MTNLNDMSPKEINELITPELIFRLSQVGRVRVFSDQVAIDAPSTPADESPLESFHGVPLPEGLIIDEWEPHSDGASVDVTYRFPPAKCERWRTVKSDIAATMSDLHRRFTDIAAQITEQSTQTVEYVTLLSEQKLRAHLHCGGYLLEVSCGKQAVTKDTNPCKSWFCDLRDAESVLTKLSALTDEQMRESIIASI